MNGHTKPIASARTLIAEALAILDAEGHHLAAANLGHVLDLLDAETESVSDPARQ